jgi:uncharacterized protein (TIGR00369 family)
MTEPVTSRTRTVSWSDPAPAAQAGLAMSGLEYLTAMLAGELPAPPIGILLGLGAKCVESGRVVFELEPGEHLYNPIGLVHGGALATLLDSVTGCAVHSALPAGTRYATTGLSLSFMRAVTADTGLLTAEGRVTHVGRRAAYANGEIRDRAGGLIATAQATCAVLH